MNAPSSHDKEFSILIMCRFPWETQQRRFGFNHPRQALNSRRGAQPLRVGATRRAKECVTWTTLPNTRNQLGQPQIPAARPLAGADPQTARCDLAAADGTGVPPGLPAKPA